jgi:hypothetical protein
MKIVIPTAKERMAAVRGAREAHAQWRASLAWKPRAPSAYDRFRRSDGTLNYRAMEEAGFDVS